jgi:serine/threonine protein kinase
VDYYALGVIIHEFMLGRRPYYGKDRKEIREQILARQAMLKTNELPPGWSEEAADIVNRLLQRKQELRLGANGIAEIKLHPWFNGIDWVRLSEKQLTSPFMPEFEENFD